MTPTTIIVATPHAPDLTRWQQVLSEAEGLTIVAHAPGLMQLFTKVENSPPKLVLVSADLCEAQEFELMISLFKALDVLWVAFESLAARNAAIEPALMSRGGGLFPISLRSDALALIQKVHTVAPRRDRLPEAIHSGPTSGSRRYKRMVMIGSSTGGVEALKNVLRHFLSDCPPTIVVQHTGQGFGPGLATVLGRTSAARVKMFAPDLPMESGTVYLVAGQPHHAILQNSVRPHLGVSYDPPMSGHCPSIDKLFLSAVPLATRIVAAVLTGMGSDGAQGLLALREAGARTLAQDKATSIVYGMPAAAWSIGAAMKQVALPDIGPGLLAEAAR